MTPPAVTRAYRELPLGLLVPPELVARSSMDEEKLEELARDIRRQGVLQPLLVAPVGDRYEIIAGHRRYLASGRAGLVAVPCLVYPTKDAAHESAKYAENRFREDMGPAEEAIYFAELLERDCGDDVDVLCERLGEKRSYVEGRLLLLRGDERVFQALERGDIVIGVAHQLNKVTEELHRRYLLDAAVRGGATIAVVNSWVQQWDAQHRATGGAVVPAPSDAPSPGAMVANPFVCAVCRGSDNVHLMQSLFIHQHCRMAILDKLLASYHGE